MVTSTRHLGNTKELRKTIDSSENKGKNHMIYFNLEVFFEPSNKWSLPGGGQVQHCPGMLDFSLVLKKKNIKLLIQATHIVY